MEKVKGFKLFFKTVDKIIFAYLGKRRIKPTVNNEGKNPLCGRAYNVSHGFKSTLFKKTDVICVFIKGALRTNKRSLCNIKIQLIVALAGPAYGKIGHKSDQTAEPQLKTAFYVVYLVSMILMMKFCNLCGRALRIKSNGFLLIL